MTPVDISVVIVNWNSKDYLRRCLDSILTNTRGVSYEIIVVDSGSFDGTGEMLQRNYPDVRFVQCERNIGFGRANNIGVRHARGTALLLLNPDTEIHDNAIGRLHEDLRALPRAGVIGCRLLNADGSLQVTCIQPFPSILNQVLDARVLKVLFPLRRTWMSAVTFERAESPAAVEVVIGACMMIRKAVFDDVGGFSPEFFMYAEDSDLCHRIRALGLTNYYVREVQIVHHGGGSAQRQESRFACVMKRESISRLLQKTHGASYGTRYRMAMSAAAAARLGLLALYLPVAMVRGEGSTWQAAFGKWIAVARWGLGLEGWVRKYDLPAGAAGPDCGKAGRHS